MHNFHFFSFSLYARATDALLVKPPERNNVEINRTMKKEHKHPEMEGKFGKETNLRKKKM